MLDEILGFLGQEARGLWGAFWRVFWKVALAVAVLVAAAGLVGSRGGAGDSAVAYVALGLYFGAIVGATAGLFAALWRLFGASLLAVLVITPILVVMVLWMFHAPIASSAMHFLDSVAASARSEGLQHTEKAMQGMSASCGGGAIAVLLLVLVSPFLLVDVAHILANTSVLWAFLKFAGAMALALAVATAAAFLFASPILAFALVRRGRQRYGQRASSAPPASL